jgi:hypothetical protein
MEIVMTERKVKVCPCCLKTPNPLKRPVAVCWDCSQTIKQLAANARALESLRKENYLLRVKLEIASRTPGSIPPKILAQIIRLCHPDKHPAGSQSANDVTVWLLKQRRAT